MYLCTIPQWPTWLKISCLVKLISSTCRGVDTILEGEWLLKQYLPFVDHFPVSSGMAWPARVLDCVPLSEVEPSWISWNPPSSLWHPEDLKFGLPVVPQLWIVAWGSTPLELWDLTSYWGRHHLNSCRWTDLQVWVYFWHKHNFCSLKQCL